MHEKGAKGLGESSQRWEGCGRSEQPTNSVLGRRRRGRYNVGERGRGGLGHLSGSRGVETDLKSFLKSYGNVSLDDAGISPGFKQSEGQVLC